MQREGAAGRWARLNRWEGDLVERVVPAGPPPQPLLTVSTFANGSRLWLAIAAALALRRGLRRSAVDGVVAVALAAGGTQVVQRLVRRPRPSPDHPARRGLATPGSTSFPSSHTAVAVAFTTAVARQHPRLAGALAPLALTLAYGRIRLRLHWPSDVVAGAVLGFAAGRWRPFSSRTISSLIVRHL